MRSPCVKKTVAAGAADSRQIGPANAGMLFGIARKGRQESHADTGRYRRPRRTGVHLTLPGFTPDTAWQLGTIIRDLAIARKVGIVIDVRRFGSPHQQLFYSALAGTTPDNQRWVARKINTVARFHKSSYHVGRLLEQTGLSFGARYNLPEEDYAAHGGCFPIIVAGTGIVGAVTVLRPAAARGPQPGGRSSVPANRPRQRRPETSTRVVPRHSSRGRRVS